MLHEGFYTNVDTRLQVYATAEDVSILLNFNKAFRDKGHLIVLPLEGVMTVNVLLLINCDKRYL